MSSGNSELMSVSNGEKGPRSYSVFVTPVKATICLDSIEVVRLTRQTNCVAPFFIMTDKKGDGQIRNEIQSLNLSKKGKSTQK